MGSFDDLIEDIKEPEEDKHETTKSKVDRILEENDVEEKIVDFEPIEEPEKKETYFSKAKEKMAKQKTQIKDKTTKKIEQEVEWTDEEKKVVKNKFIERVKATRKERRRIRKGEHNLVLDSQKIVIGFGFISMMFLFLMWQYNQESQAITAIVFIVGSFLFMPLGAILGWVFLDPYMRCKIMRKMSKGRRNYGLVNFVGKSNKIVSRIKNFDEDLIWIKNKCWALSRSGIYEIDKNGEQATHKQALDPDSFVTVTESVPTMFIDINSMQPLTFEKTGREGIAPEELGSTLKGWVDNQMAKVMFLKKSLDMYFIIVILCSLASAYFGYTNNQQIIELEEKIQELTNRLTTGIIVFF